MKPSWPNADKSWVGSRSDRRGGARIFVLVTVAFVVGLGVGAYFYYRHVQAERPVSIEAPGVVLSEATQAVLQRLESPVDITLYAPSDLAALPQALSDFAARADQLLAEYERAGQGKIRLNRTDPTSSASAKTAAGAVGILPFAGKDGAICYLGIAIARASQKETIPQLSPDWEAALESDLSRAIARVTASVATPASPATQTGTSAAPIDPAISEELLRTIPDLDSRSYDDAAKVLREASLVEFTAAVREMQAKVQATQKELAAQGNKAEADQQAAIKELQQVQAEQNQKLGEIAARLQARLQVLERLKGVNRSPSK